MTDARLAQLRRATALGEPGARAALLAERRRVGELSRERLEVAAYLGDEDARLTHGRPRTRSRRRVLLGDDELTLWAEGLLRFDREALVRVAIAAALLAPSAVDLRVALERCVLCPCAEHRGALTALVAELMPRARGDDQ